MFGGNAGNDLDDVIAEMSAGPSIPESISGSRTRYRTIWISDIHLGTRGCNADMLIDFLDSTDSERMYLVGDIIDGWRLKKTWHWPEKHNDVLWRVLKRAKRGTDVIYIPGNHDEVFRQFAGMDFGGVKIRRRAIHETADGRRLLICHGDEFDAVVLYARWLALLGDAAYVFMMKVNWLLNKIRARMGMPYWSLSKHAKHKVKNAVEFIGQFEEAVAKAAAMRGLDGVVCGHIHTAEHRLIDGVEYYNDGDWVEGCTALVEYVDGRMEILHWADVMAERDAPPDLKAAA